MNPNAENLKAAAQEKLRQATESATRRAMELQAQAKAAVTQHAEKFEGKMKEYGKKARSYGPRRSRRSSRRSRRSRRYDTDTDTDDDY